MFDAEGSCRLSFSQPVHFGYILLGAFWSFEIFWYMLSAFLHFVYLPHARSEFLVLKKISTVARVKACYVACSKHVFSHRKCFMLKEAAGWVFRSPSVSATSFWVLFGRFLFQQFSFSTFSRQAIGLIEYLIDIPRIEMTLMTRTNREKAQVVASRKKQYTVVSVSDFTLRGNCREEKEPCLGFEPGNTAWKSERSTARL